MTAEEILLELAEKGGRIVSTNDLTIFEISAARADELLYVDDNGYGFVPKANKHGQMKSLKRSLKLNLKQMRRLLSGY